jgi:hypothetical protein
MIRRPLSRRTVLRGMGTAIALPLLEAMLPRRARAAQAMRKLRFVFLYVPNGINMADWTPKTAGAGFALSPTLKPLAPFQDRLLVITGLDNKTPEPPGLSGGGHAPASSAFLTGVHPVVTGGSNIGAGTSVDQLIAQTNTTMLPSVELGGEPTGTRGECDINYSCVYTTGIAWRTPTSPLPKEIDPAQLFNRMFAGTRPGETISQRVVRVRDRKSVLDFVADDAARLSAQLGSADKRKLDEFMDSVRAVEIQVTSSNVDNRACGGAAPASTNDYPTRVASLYKLLGLAMQCDVTRVATFMLANEVSNRPYPQVGVTDGHHDTSHHGGDPVKLKKLTAINTWHVQQAAAFLRQLDAAKEGDASVLDNTVVVYGAGLSDGDMHNYEPVALWIAGRGAGALNPGRHLVIDKPVPLANLHVSLLGMAGVKVASFGNATGPLAGI